MTFTNHEKRLLLGYGITAGLLLLVILVLGLTVSNPQGGVAKESIIDFESTSGIASIRIIDPEGEQPVQLVREQGDQWMVRYPDEVLYSARSQRVQDFLQGLASLTGQSLVTSSQENYSIYQVDEQAGLQVQLGLSIEADPVRTIYFGKYTPSGTSVFVRSKSDPKVYTTGTAVDFYLNQGLPYWTDLRLWPDGLNPEEIFQISIKGSEGETTVIRAEEEGWIIEPEENKLSDDTNGYIKQLASLELSALDTAPISQQNLDSAPTLEISITLHSGLERGLALFNQEESVYAVWSEQDTILLRGTLPEWRLDQLIPE